MMLHMRPLNLAQDHPRPSLAALVELWPLAAIGIGGLLTLAWCLFLAWTTLGMIGLV